MKRKSIFEKWRCPLLNLKAVRVLLLLPDVDNLFLVINPCGYAPLRNLQLIHLCIPLLLFIILWMWIHYRRVILSKNRTLYRFINGEEYWHKKWMLLMNEYTQLKQSVEKTDRPAETLQETPRQDSGLAQLEALQDERKCFRSMSIACGLEKHGKC